MSARMTTNVFCFHSGIVLVAVIVYLCILFGNWVCCQNFAIKQLNFELADK